MLLPLNIYFFVLIGSLYTRFQTTEPGFQRRKCVKDSSARSSGLNMADRQTVDVLKQGPTFLNQWAPLEFWERSRGHKHKMVPAGGRDNCKMAATGSRDRHIHRGSSNAGNMSPNILRETRAREDKTNSWHWNTYFNQHSWSEGQLGRKSPWLHSLSKDTSQVPGKVPVVAMAPTGTTLGFPFLKKE